MEGGRVVAGAVGVVGVAEDFCRGCRVDDGAGGAPGGFVFGVGGAGDGDGGLGEEFWEELDEGLASRGCHDHGGVDCAVGGAVGLRGDGFEGADLFGFGEAVPGFGRGWGEGVGVGVDAGREVDPGFWGVGVLALGGDEAAAVGDVGHGGL